MASFDVMGWNETHRGRWANVDLEPPQSKAHWSRTSIKEGWEYKYGDASGFAKYTPCETPVSVLAGFPDNFVKKPEGRASTVGVEVIIKALKQAGVDPLSPGIVTFRNNLNKIFLTVVDNKKDWVVSACMLSGFPTLFLDIETSDADFETYPDSEKFTYYGYKFETLCTGGGDGVVDSTSESAVVVKSKLNDLDLLIATEVDCHEEAQDLGVDGKPEVSSFVEIKTSRLPASTKQRQNAQRFKFPKWWVQSLLGGVPKIVVGYWDNDGVIQDIKAFETHTLPTKATDGMTGYMKKQIWKPDHILSFGLEVLLWMMSYAEQDRDCHLQFRYDPRSQIIKGALVREGDLVERVKTALGISEEAAKKSDM
ncbi:hypothetical protein BSKO_13741 [Bryopsis sp. KO-2023]|nr:hypothetical protein BSKO_13741 [Bryopsis sp. KO-2023]